MVLRLVHPKQLPIRDDRLLFRLEKFPTHASRALEEDLPRRLQGLTERGGLNRLSEVGGEIFGRVVTRLQLADDVGASFGRLHEAAVPRTASPAPSTIATPSCPLLRMRTSRGRPVGRTDQTFLLHSLDHARGGVADAKPALQPGDRSLLALGDQLDGDRTCRQRAVVFELVRLLLGASSIARELWSAGRDWSGKSHDLANLRPDTRRRGCASAARSRAA